MLSRRSTRTLEWSVAVGALLLLSGALDRALHALSQADAPVPLARAVLIPFFAAAALLLVRTPRAATAAAAAAWPVLLLVAFAAASSLWSAAPATTLRWAAGLMGTTIVGVFLAVRFDLEEQLVIVCTALGAVALLSAAMVIVPPAAAGGGRGFRWAGMFEDNNLFGRAMCLSVLAFGVLAAERRDRRAVAVAGFVLCGILLLGSRSLAAQLVAGVCLLATATAARLRQRGGDARRRVMIGCALGALLGGALLCYGSGHLPTVVGRDPSLSGRTALWRETLRMSGERAWLGHGYATFWPRAQAEPARLSSSVSGLPFRHPHNGFLETLFELGAIGLLGLAAPLAFLLWRALAFGLAPRGSLWPLTCLLFLILSNVAESDFLRHKIFWALYVAVAVDLLYRTRTGLMISCDNLDVDPAPRDVHIVDNALADNGTNPSDPLLAHFAADLLWDHRGEGNCWSGNTPTATVANFGGTPLPACP
jgi:O-antigen ligase